MIPSAKRVLTLCVALALGVVVTACQPSRTPAADDASAYPQTIEAALASPERPAPERDAARHPAETLGFFGVRPGDTVVELHPGAGWYTAILGPWLAGTGGKLIVAHFDPANATPAQQQVLDQYTAVFVDRPGLFGTLQLATLSPDSPVLAADATVDAIVSFRNVHSWIGGRYAEKVFADAFRALKPGGVLGIVQHRLPSVRPQDPEARTGYVHEALVVQLATEAGFVLEERSEINANPADSANHPFGVWTLPPVLLTAPPGEPADPDFDSAPYIAIGESDRMTLRFRKPVGDGPVAAIGGQPVPPAPSAPGEDPDAAVEVRPPAP